MNVTVNVTSKKTIADTLALVGHIAALRLPPSPTRYVGKELLTPTDLRCMRAIAVFTAVPKMDLAILANIANAAKCSATDALIACKDLIACGLLTTRHDDMDRVVYETRSGS